MQPAARSSSTTLEIPAGVGATVTVNVLLTVLGLSSALVAVQVTVVVPSGKVEPEAGVQLTVGAVTSPASSTAVGRAQVTTAPSGLLTSTVMLAGTPAMPRSVSLTVTVKVWLTLLGLSSALVAVQVTVVVPIGKVEPEAGVQLTVGATRSAASSTAVGKA